MTKLHSFQFEVTCLLVAFSIDFGPFFFYLGGPSTTTTQANLKSYDLLIFTCVGRCGCRTGTNGHLARLLQSQPHHKAAAGASILGSAAIDTQQQLTAAAVLYNVVAWPRTYLHSDDNELAQAIADAACTYFRVWLHLRYQERVKTWCHQHPAPCSQS